MSDKTKALREDLVIRKFRTTTRKGRPTLSNLEIVQRVDSVISSLETTAEYKKFNKTQQLESDFDKETNAFLKGQKKAVDDENDS